MSTPSQKPPASHVAGSTAQLSTTALTTAELNAMPKVAGKATPMHGVVGVAAQAGAAGASVWKNGQHIVNQWTINQDRNSWIGVAGVGWQKLSNASDSACVALTMLSANALITKSAVNYREEADGMVHEIYVF